MARREVRGRDANSAPSSVLRRAISETATTIAAESTNLSSKYMNTTAGFLVSAWFVGRP
jgi:hypothetical protein